MNWQSLQEFMVSRISGQSELDLTKGWFICLLTERAHVISYIHLSFHSYILMSTTHDSHLLQFDGASMVSRVAPASISFALNLPTLALSNVLRRYRNEAGVMSYDDSSSLVIQVTQESLLVLEFDFSTLEYTQTGDIWTPKQLLGAPDLYVNAQTKIVAASINPSQFLLALTGGVIVLLNLNENCKLQNFRRGFFSTYSLYS